MLDIFADPGFWGSLVLLIALDVTLGADNTTALSARTAHLPHDYRKRALLAGAVATALVRLALLAGVIWLLGIARPAFAIAGWAPSWRDTVLVAGGLFLIYKAVTELYGLVERPDLARAGTEGGQFFGLGTAIVQIAIIGALYAVDSVMLAVGVSPHVDAMTIALIASVALLFFFAPVISAFLARHRAIKAVALAVLLLIGTLLTAEGFGMPVARANILAGLGFAVLVLAIAKLVQHFAAESPAETGIVSTPAPDMRAEPVMEPVSEPLIAQGGLEPAVWDEGQEPVFDEQFVAPEVEIEDEGFEPLELVEPLDTIEFVERAELEEVSDADDEAGVVEPAELILAEEDDDLPEDISDTEALGEDEPAVQRSRPKRKRPARPQRLRTGKRRD